MTLNTYYGAIRDTDFKVEVKAYCSQDARYKIARAYRLKHPREQIAPLLARVVSKRTTFSLDETKK